MCSSDLKLACTTCAIAAECPEFREGFLCAYLPALEGLSMRRTEHVMPVMIQLADIQVRRAIMAYTQETTIAGGMIDPRVTAQLREAMAVAREMYELTRATDPRNAPTRVVIEERSDGSMHMSASAPQGAPAQGVLSRLFGATTKTEVFGDGDGVVEAIDVKPST